MIEATAAEKRRSRWMAVLFAVVLLTPCLYGFGTKFYELILVYQGESDGAFAVAPIVNYLLASAGFLFMFGWAAANGMFADIERPKYRILETEQQLDAQG
jgi:hypothetical protein